MSDERDANDVARENAVVTASKALLRHRIGPMYPAVPATVRAQTDAVDDAATVLDAAHEAGLIEWTDRSTP